jgi:hypothetical protein
MFLLLMPIFAAPLEAFAALGKSIGVEICPGTDLSIHACRTADVLSYSTTENHPSSGVGELPNQNTRYVKLNPLMLTSSGLASVLRGCQTCVTGKES